MKAVGYTRNLPVTDPACLVDLELPAPEPGPRDLLVEVRAVSVNPVDTKQRAKAPPPAGQARVLGFDAAGVVKAVGAQVTLFRPGDEVYYAGDRSRPGSNAELHAVDERIVALKPKSLSFAQAAALPLTSITAWELLFDRFCAPRRGGAGQAILVIGGAGGVGSMMVQFARRLTALTVIATASRPESARWCADLGAHHVVDYRKGLPAELKRVGIPEVEYIASLTQTAQHYPHVIEMIKPQGKFGLIDELPSLDAMPLKQKCVSLHWEAMFTRPMFDTPDMIEQHKLLAEVAACIDSGTLRGTQTQHYGKINAQNLARAHALVESGTSIGKVVLEGF